MNPFDLRGPQFLLFYALLAAVVLIAVRQLRDFNRRGNRELDLADPYLIAYLRAGAGEAIRVATLSLLDRRLLASDGSVLTTSDAKAIDIARRPLEKRILATCWSTDRSAGALADDGELIALADHYYRAKLESKGLLAGPNLQTLRVVLGLFAGLLLASVALLKIAIAFSRGHYNIIFLVLLSIVSLLLIPALLQGRITAEGERMLGSLRSVYEGLIARARRLEPGGATNELALLAAVFGLAAVPLTIFPDAKQLIPVAAPARASAWSSESSSCASSCSSCGSSCGGGGGCGGCGGCGGD